MYHYDLLSNKQISGNIFRIVNEQSAKYHILRTIFSLERYSCFEAVQRDFERPVIFNQLQLYYSDSAESLKDCEREIKRWSALQHPNLPQPIDGWAEEKRVVFIWLAPRGVGLDSFIREKKTPDLKQAIEIALQIASVLRHLHQQGLYHGNLSPGCFSFTDEKWITLLRTSLPERLNRIFEQADTGLRQMVDVEKLKRADLSGWGTIMGALLTSDTYFGYKKEINTKSPLLDTIPPSIRRQFPQLYDEFETIILKALYSTHRPEQGYTSFDELHNDISRLRETYLFHNNQSTQE